jgi:formylmethanofuran dehydrogenase subunit E
MEQSVIDSEDFRKCAAFHGHICPGLSIGFRAAKAGLDWLNENRALDEELVAVVENNACGTDAVQVLTGCTFGKGNFIFKDHGKQVFTFFGRQTGRGVRVSLIPGNIKPDPRHQALMAKIRKNEANDKEKEEFQAIHQQRIRDVLEAPLETLFKLQPAEMPPPPKARIEPSINCDQCGEPTMASRLTDKAGKKLCPDCKG